MKSLSSPSLSCLVCGQAGKQVQLTAPGNVLVWVTICKTCASDRFRLAECFRRVGVHFELDEPGSDL